MRDVMPTDTSLRRPHGYKTPPTRQSFFNHLAPRQVAPTYPRSSIGGIASRIHRSATWLLNPRRRGRRVYWVVIAWRYFETTASILASRAMSQMPAWRRRMESVLPARLVGAAPLGGVMRTESLVHMYAQSPITLIS
jgi:hypothetical protein